MKILFIVSIIFYVFACSTRQNIRLENMPSKIPEVYFYDKKNFVMYYEPGIKKSEFVDKYYNWRVNNKNIYSLSKFPYFSGDKDGYLVDKSTKIVYTRPSILINIPGTKIPYSAIKQGKSRKIISLMVIDTTGNVIGAELLDILDENNFDQPKPNYLELKSHLYVDHSFTLADSELVTEVLLSLMQGTFKPAMYFDEKRKSIMAIPTSITVKSK